MRTLSLIIFTIPSIITGLLLGWGFSLIDFIICKFRRKLYTNKDTIQNHKDADYLLTKGGLIFWINISVWGTLIFILI